VPLSAAKVFKPRPLDGWALQIAVNLDTVSPNFLSFLFCTSGLRRQAIFAALATLTREKPETLAACLCPLAPADCNSCRNPYEQIARALMVTSRAREIIRAAFGQVSDGLLGVLRRLGDAPLSEPALYWMLYETFANPEHRVRARALIQRSGPIHAKHIEIVHRLDPTLVHPHILDRIRCPSQVDSVNAALTLIRGVVSAATDQAIRQSVESLGDNTDLAAFFNRWLQKMDRPPARPPIPEHDPDVVVLTSGEAMAALGRRLRNCSATRIIYSAQGSEVLIEWKHPPGLVAQCHYLTNGDWVLTEIHARGNGSVEPAAAAAFRRKLQTLGIPALSPGDTYPDTYGVRNLLGAWGGMGNNLGFDDEVESGLADLVREFVEIEEAA